MEASPRSETVAVLADMSEPLATEPEDEQQQQQPAITIKQQPQRHAVQVATVRGTAVAHPVAVATNVSAGVPVSLPVGSSIIGVTNAGGAATFNVITSDQLQVRLSSSATGCPFFLRG